MRAGGVGKDAQLYVLAIKWATFIDIVLPLPKTLREVDRPSEPQGNFRNRVISTLGSSAPGERIHMILTALSTVTYM